MAKPPKPVDIENRKTWVKFTPSLCDNCMAGCCTLPVPVSPEDLFHMGYVKAHEVNGPLDDVAKRLFKKGIIQAFHKRLGTFVLKQVNGHDCLFLDKNRRCKIYDRRPPICRRFPEGGPRPGYCPSQKKV